MPKFERKVLGYGDPEHPYRMWPLKPIFGPWEEVIEYSDNDWPTIPVVLGEKMTEPLTITAYREALRKMAKDYIDSMREEANWGDWIDGKWVAFAYPPSEETIDLFIADYLHDQKNFFYGKVPNGNENER